MRVRQVLRGHTGQINRCAWSPDGALFATTSYDGTARIWDVKTGECLQVLPSGKRTKDQALLACAWSPNGKWLATVGLERVVRIWNRDGALVAGSDLDQIGWQVTWSQDGNAIAIAGGAGEALVWRHEANAVIKFPGNSSKRVLACSWNANGSRLAYAMGGYISLWSEDAKFLAGTNTGDHEVYATAWSHDGHLLATVGNTGVIRVYDVSEPVLLQEVAQLEALPGSGRSVSFSSDDRLLAGNCCGEAGEVRIWRCDTWDFVAALPEPASTYWPPSIAFHPSEPLLATFDENDRAVRIWQIDVAALLKSSAPADSRYYANAKVVLLGDSGVGKSALGLVLSKQPFSPTESTHGRRVTVLTSEEIELDDGRKQTRETLLWDLAGQPDYRLIHQLHLNEVAVALVLYDARSSGDVFAGVGYWDRALRQAQRLRGEGAGVTRLLVAARIDRGRAAVGHERVDKLMRELGFAAHFETSAKDGRGVDELLAAIHGAIDWSRQPFISSNETFQQIREYLVGERDRGRSLSTARDLWRDYLRATGATASTELEQQFDASIARLESRGLARRLSFGGLVLLQPELLDSYASAIINAAREEPDGLGCISEAKARAGDFPLGDDERLADRAHEPLLLIAVVEDLITYEIAFREHGDDGPQLVFPSQFNRERADLPDPEGKAVTFGFEGATVSIYATLAVRLARSGLFKKDAMWKNAATYRADVGGQCGLFLREVDEGRGELTLFFDGDATAETRFHFEEFVHAHLERRAIAGTIDRRRVIACASCRTPVLEQVVRTLRARGVDFVECQVCEARVSIVDGPRDGARVAGLEREADAQRDAEAAVAILAGKRATRDYDVFLCHNSDDKPEVERIADELERRGILPWLDKRELKPGERWRPALEHTIEHVKSAAFFVGPSGVGPWQDLEQDGLLDALVERRIPLIPVILESCPKSPDVPLFLRGLTWVDFRERDPDPLPRLVWGITDKRDGT